MDKPSKNSSCCAIIPAYEEEGQIAQVVRGARAYATEVFVIDDGSADDTSRQAQAAGATVLRHESNRGKGLALQTGLRRAAERGHEIAVTLDGDGQQSLELGGQVGSELRVLPA